MTSPSVRAALAGLAAIDELPLGEHPAAFAAVHTDLQRALSEIDDA